MSARRQLRLAVEARIESWDHPSMEERAQAANEVGLMLEQVVRQELPDAIPARTSLDGVKELSARTDGKMRLHVVGAFHLLGGDDDSMLPVEADLDITPGALSTVKVAGEASVFAMPTTNRQFVRRMDAAAWLHSATLRLS